MSAVIKVIEKECVREEEILCDCEKERERERESGKYVSKTKVFIRVKA